MNLFFQTTHIKYLDKNTGIFKTETKASGFSFDTFATQISDDIKTKVFDYLVDNAISKEKVFVPFTQMKTMKDEDLQLYCKTVKSHLSSELRKTRVLMKGHAKTLPFGFGSDHLKNAKNVLLP